jgi:perosamine synthetase
MTFTKHIKRLLHYKFFGFVQGHNYLELYDLMYLESLLGEYSEQIVHSYEKKFSEYIGIGECVSFASGRMGFYALMRILNVKEKDEILILGATCSVMINAIIRVGAKPIFYDLDEDTFGSSAEKIKPLISSNTKMIVAQHSFGIPCDILPILKLAKEKNIFLLEDCAHTYGSKIENKVCGDFGNAALFSTDHSKPINTLIGGMIYSKDRDIIMKLKEIQSGMPSLEINHQKRLLKEIFLESTYDRPRYYAFHLFRSMRRKLLKIDSAFLDQDFSTQRDSNYPYPAKLPTFLAALGLMELQRWEEISIRKMEFFSRFISLMKGNKLIRLPHSYFDSNRLIIPLRLVFYSPNGSKIRERLSPFIDVDWTWFLQPIVATETPLSEFGYKLGSCPISELVGEGTVNIPCNQSVLDFDRLINLTQSVLASRE